MLILDPMTRCPPASMTVAHCRRSLLITLILYQHNLVDKADRCENIDWVEVNIQYMMLKWQNGMMSSPLKLYLALPVRIRQIPAQLLKFPVGVLRVKVAGFKPASVNTQEDVLPYCPEWSLKATLEMINLLQTNIRASVVVRNVPFRVGSHSLMSFLHRVPPPFRRVNQRSRCCCTTCRGSWCISLWSEKAWLSWNEAEGRRQPHFM